MTDCGDYETLMHGLLDGELDAVNAVRCEAHLSACTACMAAYNRQLALRASIRQAAPRYAPPPGLRGRIERTLAQAVRAPQSVRAMFHGLRRWSAQLVLGPALALAVGLAVFVLAPRGLDLPGQIVTSHVRSLQVSHLMDIASSDRHTVKPWFAGRIDYSPPVIDLASYGFPLAGGRLDYIDERTVAVLVYRRSGHFINLYVWPQSNRQRAPYLATRVLARNGYNMLHRTNGGMTYWCVSDLNAAELLQFQSALENEVARGG